MSLRAKKTMTMILAVIMLATLFITPSFAEDPAVKNGIVNEDGVLYYYVNNKKTQAGLILIDGYYYYVRSGGKVATGTYYCTYNMTSDIPAGTYQFDENGRMLNAPVAAPTPTPAPTAAPKIKYISVFTKPKVLSFNVGGETDYTGLSIKVLYEDGTYEIKPYGDDGMTLPELDRSVCGIQYQYVYYGGLSTYFSIRINENSDIRGIKLVKKPSTLIYPMGGFFDSTGLVVATIDKNGEQAEILPNNALSFYGFDTTNPGVIKIQVTYRDKYSTSFSIRVTEQLVTPLPTNTPAPIPTLTPTPSPTPYVKNGIVNDDGTLYYYVNGVRTQAGLIQIDGDYYYIRSGGLVAVGSYNCTNKMTSDVPAGTYMFGPDGKMINPPTPAPSPEPKDGFVRENDGIFYYKDNVLQRNAGIIVVDEGYYYVRTNGQLAVGTYSINTNNGYLKSGKYTFDENGRMKVDPYYLVGIRCARDIAFLNQTSTDVKIKEGMIYRGTEIDGAVWNIITEEDCQYAVNKLKNLGVKFDLDLRMQTATSRDMLGDDVPHKYYDMVYYEQVFTEKGKAKVKEIFTDLANPDNYPMYLHCTYGLDRTGTTCYLIEALIGMNDWNLSHDYCWTIGSHEPSILRVKEGLINNYEGATRQEQVINYLLDCGLTMEQLNTIRSILTK